jgi:hypothetical protein
LDFSIHFNQTLEKVKLPSGLKKMALGVQQGTIECINLQEFYCGGLLVSSRPKE